MPRPVLARPLSLLLLVTALFTCLIQSGELGTSDAAHRLQVTHSLWTGQPQVFPYEYPDFGVHGRGGSLYATYGIGQSLLMLPADIAATAASHLPWWRSYVVSEADPTVRNIFVSISTNVLINVLTALAAWHMLCLLGFSARQSIAGALGLLCATTHLHYAQNMTENNYILLLTLTGFALQYRWLTTGDRRSLFWGSIALGLNLLTRLTTALDILGVACFLILAILFDRFRAPPGEPTHLPSGHATTSAPATTSASLPLFPRVRTYLTTALPVYLVFLLLDRIYQYVRFASWTTTYLGIWSREQRALTPILPSSFPFDGHWFQGGIDSGVIGPLFSPEKSIFLFDPMLPLTLLLVVVLWSRLAPPLRAFLVASFLLLASYIAFYARYHWWAGDYAWGDRYISSAVQLTTLLAIPILLRHRRSLRQPIWYFALCMIAGSLVVQCASLAFWLPLEIDQIHAFGHPACVVLLRFRNIAAFALQPAAWRVNTSVLYPDPWDVAHLTSLNVLPSLLHQVGAAPLWVVHLLYGVWLLLALALVFASAKLVRLSFPP